MNNRKNVKKTQEKNVFFQNKSNAIKLLFAIILVSILTISFIFLTGCNTNNVTQTFKLGFYNGSTTEYLTIDYNDYNDKNVVDVLQSNTLKDSLNVDLTISEQFGAYVNSIYGITPDFTKNEFIALYVTLSDYSSGDEYIKIIDNITFYSSVVGISSLPVKVDAVYLFYLDGWASVEPEVPQFTTPTLADITYNSNTTLADIALPDGFSWDNPTVVPTVDNTSYKATFTPQDTINYTTVSLDLSLKTLQAIPEFTTPTLSDITYNPITTLADIALPDGFSWDNPTIIPTVDNNSYKATFTPQDTINYTTVSLDLSLKTLQATPEFTTPTLTDITYSPITTLADITLPNGFFWKDNTQNILVGNNNYIAIFTPQDTINYKTIELNLSLNAINMTPTLTTTLKTTNTKSDKISFEVDARDYLDNKLDVSTIKIMCTNGSTTSINYADNYKISFILFLELGSTTITITCLYNNSIASNPFKHTINREQAVSGETIGYLTFSLEATTIGRGYIIEPFRAEIKYGENGAQLLARILTDNDYTYTKTGSLESGFYLSSIGGISDMDNYKNLDYLVSKINPIYFDYLSTNDLDVNYYNVGDLGEFDFTFMSGWMYHVNGTAPNVGFADYYPIENDVVRVQFTLYGYGTDLGSGWGGDPMFELVNRDYLVEKIALINEADTKDTYGSAYTDALNLLQTMGMSQSELDSALNALIAIDLQNNSNLKSNILNFNNYKQQLLKKSYTQNNNVNVA